MALADSHQLFSIKGGLPGGKKQQKEAASELARSKNCNEALVTVTTKNFSEHLSPIRNHQTAARKELASRGGPWTSPWIIVANNDVDTVVPVLETYKQDNWTMWLEFMGIYEKVVEEKRSEMGDLFNPEHFPDIEKLREKWTFEVLRDVVPDPEHDIRAGWSYKQMNDMKAAMKRQEAQNLKEAMLHLLRRVRKPLVNVAEKCELYKGGRANRFNTETFIGNVRNVVDQMVTGNLTDDPEVESLRKDILKDICSLSSEDLREDESLRKYTGKKAEVILEKTDRMIERVSTFGAGLTI